MKTSGKEQKSAGNSEKVVKNRGKTYKKDAISPKKQRFCEEYVVDFNATQAMIRAGFSVRSAPALANRLLKNDCVKQEIARLKSEQSIRTQITVDRVLEELARLSFYDPKVIAEAGIKCPEDIAKLPEDVRRAIIGWSWDKLGNFTLKLSDKEGALKDLGRHLSLFTDNVSGKIEHSGKVETHHVLEFGDPNDKFDDIPGG